MTRKSLSWLALGLAAALTAGLGGGCKSAPEAPYATYHTAPKEWTPASGSDNAFDGYALAARRAVELAPDSARRVFFTPGMAAATRQALGPAIQDLTVASRKPCVVPQTTTDLFRPDPHAAGFRLLGRGLAWSIEAAVEAGEWRRAVDLTLVATKFGLDLTGGDASLGSLGEAVLADARQALTPALGRLPAHELSRLAEGLGARLSAIPSIDGALDHEEKRMMAGVQSVQEAYRGRTLDALRAPLGRDARGALDYLQRMPEAERPRYFEGFAAEARALVQVMRSRAAQSAAARPKLPEPGSEYRPWRRLSRHFFGGAEAIVSARDRVVAMTRLFLLTAAIRARVSANGKAPGSLDGFPPGWRTDPYSGRDFVYTAEGTDFRLYGVGADLRDDGGESEEAGLSPDMTLEGAGL